MPMKELVLVAGDYDDVLAVPTTRNDLHSKFLGNEVDLQPSPSAHPLKRCNHTKHATIAHRRYKLCFQFVDFVASDFAYGRTKLSAHKNED